MSMAKTNPRMNPRVMEAMEARAAMQPNPTAVAPGMKKGGKVPKEGSKEEEAMDKKEGMKKGGRVKKYARGGGIESRGKTVGKFI